MRVFGDPGKNGPNFKNTHHVNKRHKTELLMNKITACKYNGIKKKENELPYVKFNCSLSKIAKLVSNRDA